MSIDINIGDELYEFSLKLHSLSYLLINFERDEDVVDKKTFQGLGFHLETIAERLEAISSKSAN